MSDELKPVNCGCGGEAKVETDHDTIQPVAPIDWKRVVCAKCNIRTTWRKTETEAITAWNRAMSGSTEKSSTVERTAKVKESQGFAVCECCQRVLPLEKYCSCCGARLEWE